MFLSLCWLLVAIAYEAEGLVAEDFTKCSEVFYKQKMPVGLEVIAKPHDFKEIPDGIKKISDLASPAYICQTHGSKSYYASLYDRGRRIPLYSAYILDRKEAKEQAECKRPGSFQLEPQLIYRELTENMQLINPTKQKIKEYNKNNGISEKYPKNQQNSLIKASQAIDDDYIETRSTTKAPTSTTTTKYKSNYSRGHLNPCGHHNDPQNYKSTFTLTNVVPMKPELNNDVWSEYEIEMIKISADCGGKMYVVTGSVPGNNALKDRVTIPNYVWNAYCCVDNLGKPVKSGGAIAANDKELAPNKKFKVEKMELGALQLKLKNLLKLSNNFEIFACDCKERKGNKRCNSI
ncbi:endonuclease domain-containing 1 protein-like [Rana temporaria]|uniref:endonuclease domain-containing 1 protein-like n=1 Tax=Rana temporaria TaxID=8407 RepID=UPI001AAD29B6|nr:endonuclease domain-containing 1 protein-like [Rana temporaria]